MNASTENTTNTTENTTSSPNDSPSSVRQKMTAARRSEEEANLMILDNPPMGVETWRPERQVKVFSANYVECLLQKYGEKNMSTLP